MELYIDNTILPNDFGDIPTIEQKKLGYVGKKSDTEVKAMLLNYSNITSKLPYVEERTGIALWVPPEERVPSPSIPEKKMYYLFRKTTSRNTHPQIFYLSFIYKNSLIEIPFELLNRWNGWNVKMRLLNYDNNNELSSRYERDDVDNKYQISRFTECLIKFDSNYIDMLHQRTFMRENIEYYKLKYFISNELLNFIKSKSAKSNIHVTIFQFLNTGEYQKGLERPLTKKNDLKRLKLMIYLAKMIDDINSMKLKPYYLESPSSLKQLATKSILKQISSRGNLTVDDIYTVHNIFDMLNVQNEQEEIESKYQYENRITLENKRTDNTLKRKRLEDDNETSLKRRRLDY